MAKRFFLILFCLMVVMGIACGQDEGQPGFLRNPLNAFRGPDPWLTYYDGNYYLAATTGASYLTMRKSPTLAGLKTAAPVQIYAETDPSRCCNMWAPEFHLLEAPDGTQHWYFYYTAGTSGTLDNQHSHVLESAGTDPMGPYTYKARIFDPANDTWMIDGSVMTLDDTLYFLSSVWVGDYQSLFIAPMRSPWELGGARVMIARSEYDWEKSGLNVTEGPVALQHNGKTFIIYSASFCATPDYALGMLTYNGGDPLSPESWEKHPEPVFQRSDENSVFGPGHNGFFKSPDGTEDWIVYHANNTETGVCDDNRNTRVQKFTWNDDGTPNSGVPVSTDELIAAPSGDTGIDPVPDFAQRETSRFQSFAIENGYIRHVDTAVRVDLGVMPPADAEFIVVPGLADPAAFSFESVNLPGAFLRHQNNVIWTHINDGSDTFAGDATWHMRPGLADAGWMSFESFNQPGSFIGMRFGILALVKDDGTEKMHAEATYREEN